MPRISNSKKKSSVVPFAASAHHISTFDQKKPPVVAPAAPGFGQVLKEGLAFGVGQATAHNLVNSFFGTNKVQTIQVASKCNPERTAFENCLKTKTLDEQCSSEMISLQQCKQLNE